MSPWKWLSKCECGPGKTRLRSRNVVVEPHGNGKNCGIQKQNVRCGIKCQCARYEFGPSCENQHCVVGPWSDPCKDLKDVSGCTWGHKAKRIFQKFRVREVTHEVRGTGRKCPELRELIFCPPVATECKSFSEWLSG